MKPSVALVHYNGLGDHLLAWPALRAIAEVCELTLFDGPGGQFAFYRDVAFHDRVPLCFDDDQERDVAVNASLAGAPHCESFVSIASWVNPTLLELAHGIGAKRTIGFFHPFDESIPLRSGRHMLDNYFDVAKHMAPNIHLEPHLVPPRFSDAAHNAAKQLRRRVGHGDQKLLFVHPETKADKMWSARGFSETLSTFLERRPNYDAVVVSKEPFEFEHDPKRVHFVHPHLELALAFVDECDLFLGVDSVFLHAADLYRVPGIALFGPASDARSWGFRVSPRGHDLSTASFETLAPTTVVGALLEVA